jgi:hypothetical protein
MWAQKVGLSLCLGYSMWIMYVESSSGLSYTNSSLCLVLSAKELDHYIHNARSYKSSVDKSNKSKLTIFHVHCYFLHI